MDVGGMEKWGHWDMEGMGTKGDGDAGKRNCGDMGTWGWGGCRGKRVWRIKGRGDMGTKGTWGCPDVGVWRVKGCGEVET